MSTYYDDTESMPAPFEPITAFWQREYELKKNLGVDPRIHGHKGGRCSGRVKNFYAMYCPSCGEWNGEPGDFPGYCSYCGEELKVMESPEGGL